ncbi:fimbrial protein [Photobacterium damselae]|uniref:fimbrial protein n=1 Tax=Photobacterium damselae TaxID=38293 RepID=UPI00406942F4
MSGIVVASACSVVVESGASQLGVIDFGQYNQAKTEGGVNKAFSVKLYELGSTTPGCSAFQAGSGAVTLKFGDQGQLDNQGVITRGAGDNIRIAISATDGEASNQETITSKNSALSYSKEFAVKGNFGFNAKAEGLDSAIPGDYSGSLSLVVTYK